MAPKYCMEKGEIFTHTTIEVVAFMLVFKEHSQY